MNFECLKGCSFCCSPVPMTPELFNVNIKKRQMWRGFKDIIVLPGGKILVYTEDFKCIFLNKEGRCEVYNDRPDECRKYGVVKISQCPYLKINGEKRSKAKTKHRERLHTKKIGIMKTELKQFRSKKQTLMTKD